MNVPSARRESRWPAALSILCLLLLVKLLPHHLHILPPWGAIVVAAAAWVPMAGVVFGADEPWWSRVERVVLIAVAASILVSTVASLALLISHIVGGSSPMSGIQLLTSSVLVWACNVLGFTLLFWQIDGGGPAGRSAGPRDRRDWLFAQAGAGDAVAPDWRPGFVDYLFLGFSTAAAFSAADAVPLTPRAKLLMLIQALISLVTLVVVASRAINVLAA